MPTAYTLAELLALPYTGTSNQNAGLSGERYRADLRARGVTVELWRATLDENGKITGYSEVTLSDAVRARVTQFQRSYIDVNGSVVHAARATVWVMPDEIDAATSDRLIITSGYTTRKRATFKRSGNSIALPYRPVSSIISIHDNAGNLLVAGTDYTATADGLTFTSNAVADGEKFVITWLAMPTFEIRTDEQTVSPPGVDSVSLPVGLNCVEVKHGG